MHVRRVLTRQDSDGGGIADRPGDMADIFHTMFGLAGLALLGHGGLRPIDPVTCMPKRSEQKMK